MPEGGLSAVRAEVPTSDKQTGKVKRPNWFLTEEGKAYTAWLQSQPKKPGPQQQQRWMQVGYGS
ncbi:MAG: hypothetical protein AB7H77_07865 [Bdellovibrionales bacterium]